MVPANVLTKLAEQAPFALILGGFGLLSLYAFLRAIRAVLNEASVERTASAQERQETQERFLAFLAAREAEDDARAQETRACIDRNTTVIARATVALERSEERDQEWRKERRAHQRT